MSDDQIYVAFAVAPIATAKEIAARRLHRLSEETGFSIEQCRQELLAEEDDYFAALRNLRNVVIESHAEALEMDKEITFVREFESLTADQAMAYAQQWAYSNADAATKLQMFDRDHIEALGHEGVRNCAIADNAYVLTKPVEFRNRQFLWENTGQKNTAPRALKQHTSTRCSVTPPLKKRCHSRHHAIWLTSGKSTATR